MKIYDYTTCQFICKTVFQTLPVRTLSVRFGILGILLVLLGVPMTGQATDMIWVQKSKRLLHLIEDSRITATYPIALGANPKGHKQREGDLRTPEGLYLIDWDNPDSDYYLSLHISYPSHSDIYRASQSGVMPGKNIMIHGQPNSETATGEKRLQRESRGEDWTDGCIALSNEDMLAVWNRVEVGVPILIDP